VVLRAMTSGQLCFSFRLFNFDEHAGRECLVLQHAGSVVPDANDLIVNDVALDCHIEPAGRKTNHIALIK
jgi:hypothetical protein